MSSKGLYFIQHTTLSRIRGCEEIPMEPYLAEFRTAKRSGHSMGLSICYNSLTRAAGLSGSEPADQTDLSSGCGGHQVISNGARWNDELGRCELHIKNSHGTGPDVPLRSDWYDAQTVLSHSTSVEYYRIRGR